MKKLGRYSVYELIGKTIELQGEDFTKKGCCTDVFRDPLSNNIIISIDDENHAFHEPDSIMGNENSMRLTNGGTEEFEDQHEALEEEDESNESRLEGFHRITKEHAGCRLLKIKIY